MRVTQVTIAKTLGMSCMSVSKALRGHKDIPESTRLRVLDAVKKLGYRPNRIGKSLISGRTRLLGALFPNFEDRFHAGLLQAMESEARQLDFRLLPMQFDHGHPTGREDVYALLQYQPDGLIVLPRQPDDWDFYRELAAQDRKLVLIDTNMDWPSVSCVYSDDENGTRAVMEHLLGLGHRRMVHLAAPAAAMVSTTCSVRREGFSRILSEAGVEAEDRQVVNSVNEAAELLRDRRATAAFCFNDNYAGRLLRRLREWGVRVPEDVSVAGYGDTLAHPELQAVPLTTVSQFPEEMGREAVRSLSEILDRQIAPNTKCIATKLIVRGSTTPPSDP